MTGIKVMISLRLVVIILLYTATALCSPWTAALSNAPRSKSSHPQCREVAFKVNGSAQNRNISTAPFNDPVALEAAIRADAWPRYPVSGEQTLVGVYCDPVVRNANNGKLQVLFGSITTNRDTWNAQGGSIYDFLPYQPETYSWVMYAAYQGYPTLSMDRLGAGKSSHPDPAVIVQGPYEYALYHDLVQQIRGGSPNLPYAFNYMVYVGNSYGSVTGNQLSHLYPQDFDAFVLTGFTKSVLPSLGGIALQAVKPASTVWPARFASLADGFVTSPVEASRTNSFFGSPADVDFDPMVAYLFWEREDVVSLGQFITTYSDIVAAPEYRGRVLVLTGEQDQAFCGPGSPVKGPAKCGSLLKDTKSLFPNADYSWKSIDRTGHALILHRSAPYSLQVAHLFLAGYKFEG